MSIAIYKVADGVLSGSFTLNEVDEWIEKSSGYIRMTEPLDVEFTRLPAEETLDAEVGALEREREKIVAEKTAAIARIDDRISKLRAITHQP
jgi:hypothetical protein